MGGSGGPPQSIHGESENIKSLGGSFPCHPQPPKFILYLKSPLLVTFYTLSFIDYIHVYPRYHPPTNATHATHAITLHQPTELTICMYVCVYVCVYVCILYAYIYICHPPPPHTHLSVCTSINPTIYLAILHTPTPTHPPTPTQPTHPHTRTHPLTPTPTHPNTHTPTHIHICTYTHIHIHTYTHTRIHASPPPPTHTQYHPPCQRDRHVAEAP